MIYQIQLIMRMEYYFVVRTTRRHHRVGTLTMYINVSQTYQRSASRYMCC